MLFYYPKNALTFKDLDSAIYLTYSAMSLNMNQHNHDSSNTFFLLNIAAKEFIRSKYDIEYQPSFALTSVDFTTIDRINRFQISNIKVLERDSNNGAINAVDLISGYSSLTNSVYQLENVNTYSDFIRHSIPCDIFLEGRSNTSTIVRSEPLTILLQPFIKTNIYNFNVKNSKITINILSDNIQNYLTSTPKLKITGINKNFEEISEYIEIDKAYNLDSVNEYISITSITSYNIEVINLSIIIYPYLYHSAGKARLNFVDREDLLTEYESLYTLDKNNKTLNLSLNNSINTFPSIFNDVECIPLNLPDTFSIDKYIFDEDNGLLYTICIDDDNEKYLIAFPISIPFSYENIRSLKNTQNQTLKISYIRDTVNKLYSFEVFPTSSDYNFESMEITLKYSYKTPKGLWQQNRSYQVGDLVEYGGNEYICKFAHISSIVLDTDKFINANVYITKDFLLELIYSGIESNKFDISFDLLFPFDTECIVDFTTNGVTNCTQQILCQYHKLDPCLIKSFKELFTSFKLNDKTAYNESVLSPIENDENKVLNLSNQYRYSEFGGINIYGNFYLWKDSSTGEILLDDFKITNVYNTFFLDYSTDTLITSDTITHIFNENTDDIQVYEKFIISRFDDNDIPIIISDSYNRLFVNKKGQTYAT